MKRNIGILFLIVFFAASLQVVLYGKQPLKPFATPSPVFVQEFLGQLDFAQSRLVQLAEAVPQDKYSWRPADGIRSVGEVYLHAAAGNYLLLKMLGLELPTAVGKMLEGEKWDKQTTDKKEIIKILKKSFDDVKEATKSFSQEELDKQVHVFGMDMSVRNFMISMIGHLHEHLGQSIAYARMNDVTPPWSKKSDG